MPQLVNEDQQAEAEDRDEDRHAGCSAPRGELPRLVVGGDQVVEVARGRAVDAGERLLHHRRDVEEPDLPFEEGGDGHLVRGVEGTRRRAASLSRRAGERQHRERVGVGRLEREVEPREVELRDVRRGAIGIGQRERDRHAHVGQADVRQERPVAEADERVHDGGRMDHHLDPVVRRRRRASAPRSARVPCSRAWPSRS